MGSIYLPESASKARQRDAENARRNRAEIVRELSWGRVSRRDLIKWGLFTSAGLLAPIGGLNPFVGTAWADGDGIPRSPLFGAKPFTQPMPRFDVLERKTMDSMSPICMPEANTTPIKVPDELGGGWGPCEGRPPGPVWAHQHFDKFPPSIWVEATQAPAKTNTTYDPRVLSTLNSGIDPSAPIPVQFHPSMPIQLPTRSGHSTARCPEAGDRPLWGADALPASQRATCRRQKERRLRPPRDLDHEHNGPTGPRTTASPGPTSSRASSTTITGRSSSPARPWTPARRPARPMAMAG